jgi:hypothetical protein
MSDHPFDIMTRRAMPAATRRGALAALGGATITALLALRASAANRRKKPAGKGANSLCVRQDEPCRAAIRATCEGQPGCQRSQNCCEELRTCDMRGFLGCIGA